MNWWGDADGTADKAFNAGFKPIPNNTTAKAQVFAAELGEDRGFGHAYQITWQIIEGEYLNRRIFQKLKCFDADEMKAAQAKNMLLLLMKMFHVKPGENPPTTQELGAMIGGKAMIKVGYAKIDGKDFNMVREVHDSDSGQIESAFSRNQTVLDSRIENEDLPF